MHSESPLDPCTYDVLAKRVHPSHVIHNLRIEFGKLLSVITFYLFSGMVRLTGNLVYGPYFNK